MWPIEVSAYVAAIVVAIIVWILEVVRPRNLKWRPGIREFFVDALFMITMRVFIPLLLGLSIGQISVEVLEGHLNFWPNTLAPVTQFFLLYMSAELLRYWHHRLMHEISDLWRFHAVHHSVDKLYWLNVGRFHFVEEAIRYFLETLFFLVIGVTKEIMIARFLVYSAIGFVQHANIRLSFGWLNLLISTPELHAWHHSIKKHQANRNYGTTLIVWDLVFGTWFLPKDQTVNDLGLGKHIRYPKDFIGLMIVPFFRGAEHGHRSEIFMKLAYWVKIIPVTDSTTRGTDG